jgi:hypothetical protein
LQTLARFFASSAGFVCKARWGAGTRAPSWRCARPGARLLATCMDGTGQGRPRAQAAPPRGSGVDRLSERSTNCSARDNALPGTAMQERGIHMVAARPGVFCPLLSCDEHNCSSRNSWPQTLLSRRTHRTRHPEHANTATIPLPSAESSAAQPVWMLTAMPAGRCPLPGPRGLCGEPGPSGVSARRNSLGKALGSVLTRAGASPLRVAVTTNHLPCTAVSALTPRMRRESPHNTHGASIPALLQPPLGPRRSPAIARHHPPRRGARAHPGPSRRRDQPRLPWPRAIRPTANFASPQTTPARLRGLRGRHGAAAAGPAPKRTTLPPCTRPWPVQPDALPRLRLPTIGGRASSRRAVPTPQTPSLCGAVNSDDPADEKRNSSARPRRRTPSAGDV